MKKLFFLFMLLLATSCVDKVDTSSYMKDVITKCETFMDYQVPVVKDAVTVVTYEGDTIAVTSKSIKIKAPKNTAMTRSGEGIVVSYITKDDLNYEQLSTKTYSAYWQAVMFEDSKVGDYNDLIIHVKSVAETPWNSNTTYQTVSIQPIALGSSKNIGLGCVLSDYSEHIISDNVRRDLFAGNVGFINTVDELEPIRFKLEPKITKLEFPFDANKTYWIAWFIEVDGTRQYAVSADYEYTNYNNVVSKDGLPYGIVVANDNGTFKYPKEKVSIFNTYKSFTNWVKGSSYDIGKPEKENVYKYCFDKSINGAHKIWDYQDLQ
nr:MAG TPA: LruC domain [Caudoviricetes sp.]